MSNFHSRKESGSILVHLASYILIISFKPRLNLPQYKWKFPPLEKLLEDRKWPHSSYSPHPSHRKSQAYFCQGSSYSYSVSVTLLRCLFFPRASRLKESPALREGKGNYFLLLGDTALFWPHKYGTNFHSFFLNLRYLACQHSFKKNFIKVKERMGVSQIVKLKFFRDLISIVMGHAELNEFGGVDFSGFRLLRLSTQINWSKMWTFLNTFLSRP